MKKSEEELARELDAFLTARLKNRPAPPTSKEGQALAAVAEQLLEVAARTNPDPSVTAAQKARLTRVAAARKKSNQGRKEASFWSNLFIEVKELLTMKRIGIALGTVMAVFILAFVAWSAFSGLGGLGGGSEVADSDTALPTLVATEVVPDVDLTDGDGGVEVAQVVPDDPSTLAPLPSLAGAGGLGSGRGGGGGGGEAAASGGIATDEMGMPVFTNPFSGTNYVYNVTPSTDAAAATVYQRPGMNVLTQDDLTRFGAALGMSGPVYTIRMPEGEDFPGRSNFVPYFMFDGSRQLTMVENGIYYNDASQEPTGIVFWLSFEEAAPIAESFLQSAGLLDFPYEIAGIGPDIQFRRLIDGRPLLEPEFMVSVGADGQIWSFSYQAQQGLSAMGNYPLLSAAEAWQIFLDSEEIDYQTVFFRSYPLDNSVYEAPVLEDEYRYWQRSYSDGDAISLYPYLNVFEPLDGGVPRIMADRYIVQGAEADLRALAEGANTQVYVGGIIRDGGRSLELQEWRSDGIPEYAFREGFIQRDGDRVLLATTEGETILIPAAPADLEDGAHVYVDGWAIEPGGDLPSFNWQSIGVVVDVVSEEPIAIDSMPAFIPYVINQMTVEQVDLVYVTVPVWTDEQMEQGLMPDFILQPAWRFSGTTDGNEYIEIYVHAVPSELVSEPAG